ncbi:MAG TPA: tRNA preQ1(34) S-adenosylmethionine ribosyltransferase-isomerase QueA [Casimicrobiaceae bacterium]|jgi:S-adenosylmethionine:tRNA ribosyltransferase-isomerase|nr:tRNA preQ1(34) S-adenosylmethionine ribosyltransferase-isomerase QueA [Casimicrobiaceae bacterium]
MSLSVSDFDYELPPELIAQTPAARRRDSRLLHVTRDALRDLAFADLTTLVAPGDLMVFNDTRVLRARVHGRRDTGGRVELLLERVTAADEAWVQLRASHPPRPGGTLELPGGVRATVLARDDRFFQLRFEGIADVVAWLERHGEVPLPPYITHAGDASDSERYQTVYARHPGAVAAPTAGLHFDDELLAELSAHGVEQRFVTLHVGSGTFQPVQVEDVAMHRMHRERYCIPAETAAAVAQCRTRGNRVIAVGTTSLRALEAAADADGRVSSGDAETDLFIVPGYRFRAVDRLLTNFHLPRSTLLMLVSAFAGTERIRSAYAHAVAARYRFFSYGDAMLLERAAPD